VTLSPTFLLQQPAGDDGAPLNPVVVSVPHAGLDVPTDDAGLLALPGSALRKDADLHVDKLVVGVPALGVPVLLAQVSRYVLDVNRAPDDVDREACPEIERPARPSARGLCWRTTTDGAPVLVRPLTLTELRSRLQRIHEPYHEKLATLLAERRRHFGFAVLLDLHSMPSMGRPAHSDPGARRADIVPGDLRGTSCAPALTRLVIDHFKSQSLSVRPNDPYMGGFVTKHHGRPARGVHALQIELNRDLYMDEGTFALKADGAAVTAAMILALIERVKGLDLRT
jgi:N-formylglutamate amidohydrolase